MREGERTERGREERKILKKGSNTDRERRQAKLEASDQPNPFFPPPQNTYQNKKKEEEGKRRRRNIQSAF